jgi:MFS transporter, DHA1 family, multidrug resistance protein
MTRDRNLFTATADDSRVAIAWRRNVGAVTAASFMGYTGFTLAMPFLPLYIGQLGVSDIGEIAMWTGVSLGVTPAVTALLAPAWGRLGDRFGRKMMIERSLVSFVIIMAAMAYVTRAWHVLALRVVQGLFAGYGSLSLAMAAESAPRRQLPSAIGLVQTAQRLGPAVGPVIGGVLAGLVGLRHAFLVTSAFYAAALLCVIVLYDERLTHAAPADSKETGRVTFRNVLAFENFVLMMVVIFALQFVDRSFGPVLPLYVEVSGVAHARVPVLSGILFSIMACAGAVGHHICGRLLQRFPARRVIATGVSAAAASSVLFALSAHVVAMSCAALLVGIGIGAATTAAYSVAGGVIPDGAHGASFGVLTSASLVGMATSPFIAGFLSGTSIRFVFLVNVALMALLAVTVEKTMVDSPADYTDHALRQAQGKRS